MVKYIFQSPRRYVQGKGVIADLGKELKVIGKLPYLLSDATVWEIVQNQIEDSLEGEVDYHYEEFGGEASNEEIKRLTTTGEEQDVDVVVGLGGGKTLDTAKAVADALNVPVVIVPTAASTDAPTSALSVIYSDEGVFEGYKFYNKNPDLVLMDTGIVANAPAQMFASGIADAMATLIEAKSAMKTNADTMLGGKTTLAGRAIAEAAEETLFKYGLSAYKAVQENLVTPHVERVVEANTLLSGLGFENGGLAAAHAIHNGFTALSGDIHDLSHGEKVAYGVLTQLVLEGFEGEYIQKYISFFREIGMPVTLADLHLENASFDDLLEVGKLATSKEETLKNMNPETTAEDVAYAILAVDQLSK